MSANKKGAGETPEDDLSDQIETDPGEPTETELAMSAEGDDVNLDDTAALSGGTDNVGETSVEIDVEELIAELEAEGGIKKREREGSVRKRLEEVLEERRVAHELEDLDELDSI